ncbi:hypothetical protein ABFS83_05G125200 [Erythranthe nasuta]
MDIVKSRIYFADYQIWKRNELDHQLVKETERKVELDRQLAKETKKKVELDRQLAEETEIKEELVLRLAVATEKKEELLLVGLEEEKRKQDEKVVELEEEKRKQHEKVVRLEKVVRDQEEVFVRLAEEDQKKHNEKSKRNVEERRRQEEIGLKLEPTVYQVANYNFVFQGVILTATVNGASTLKSNFIWYPLALSVIASCLNIVALVVISMRYTNCLDDVDEKTHMWYIGQYMDANNPATEKIDEGEKRLREKHNGQKRLRTIYFWIAMLLFFVFSAVVAVVICKIPGYVRTTDKSS